MIFGLVFSSSLFALSSLLILFWSPSDLLENPDIDDLCSFAAFNL